jgi:hypothetical protein
MKPPVAALLKRADRTTEYVLKHALRCNKLADEPSIMDRAPMPWLSRQRRQQARRSTELAAKLRRPSYRTRNMPAPIIETEANATGELATDHVEMLA